MSHPNPPEGINDSVPDDPREISLEELTPELRTACERAGWTSLVPVQAKSIPYLLADRDVMIQSRTGSGKTGAYLLPIMQKIDLQKNVAQAMVLVPTRELALQVFREAETLTAGTQLRTAVVYGGVGYNTQLEAFRGGAQLVVGTPGRILDHLLKNTLSLDHLKMLIFDEADRMLSMGFYPDMVKIRKYIPTGKIASSMFSATFPPQVIRLAGQFLHEPQLLSLSGNEVHIAESEHIYYVVPGMRKERSLIRIIGVVISVVAEMEKFKMQSIARFYNIHMEERQLPGDDELEKVVAERITALLEARLRSRDNIQIERMQRFLPLARSLAQAEDELAIVTMLLDDYYQQSLHAPPVQPTTDVLDEASPVRPKPKSKPQNERPRSRNRKPKKQ
jgi:ATP-dependent RNA helicase DeaD